MIIFSYYLFAVFWAIRTAKTTLFWLYLWQLKEYHIGRFTAHFQTYKGKRLIFNKVVFVKLLIFLFLALLCLIPFLGFQLYEYYFGSFAEQIIILGIISFALLFIIYFLEVILFIKDAVLKILKLPVLTKKSIFLIILGVGFEILFLIAVLRLNLWLKSSSAFFSFSKIIFYLGLELLFYDILVPAISSIIVLILQPFTALLRSQFLLKKAKKKIEDHKDLLVIGITGSYGKSSTKEFLSTILSHKFNVLKTFKNQNSEAGISQGILKNLKPEHQIFIAEMGAYRKGGIKLLTDIVRPKIGILTGINNQHLALFKSQENIIKAKYELIKSLSRDGLAVFNGANNYILGLYDKTNIKKRLSQMDKNRNEADIWAENIVAEKEYLCFDAVLKSGHRANFKVNVLGRHNIENLLLAVLVSFELKMTLDEIREAALKIKACDSGLSIKKGAGGLNIIDSSYSANFSGVISDLDYLKIWQAKKIVVMPCLIELGKDAKSVHEKIGRKLKEVSDMAIITEKDYFKEIKKGAFNSSNIIFESNPKKIIDKIKSFASYNDVVLLEGRVPDKIVKMIVN
ncbi:MAG: UDP-N-acetylmuramoyl-tripeptide--D-alanyl-D-alanine ligase [Candidatus Pacebacteria bacterium]|nr:UDP-N-acetylmuramoyl-tripeptide--D-alanyl-D-alanine ligase [Candidatus Paceibacterota bacterium]